MTLFFSLFQDKHAYKSLLQELCQKEFNKLPAYSITFSGEAHNPTFISVVEVGGEVFSGLEAKSKKKAEFNAAKVAYIALQQRKHINRCIELLTY